MTTLVEHIILVGAVNHPPMLEKSMYYSWASRIRLFIKRKKHGRMMLDSIDNDDCDVQAANIILHGLPPDVYALVNHQEAAKDIWDRVKMLMKGTKLSYQKHECRLYNLFDKFAYVLGETLYEYYWRFSQLINDTHTGTMQQVQVNAKFLNALPLEWSKFVTDVKYLDSLAFVANSPTLYNPSQSPQHSGYSILAVPMFQQGEDQIECINKEMAFLSVVASRFPPLNNQLITSSNPRNQATIQDEDLDAYDSDCDDLSLVKAVPMANLSSCDPEVLSETQDAVIQDTNPSTPNDLLVLSLVEQMIDHVAHLDKENQTNKMRIQPTLYDGNVIAKEHAVISMNDDEETLILEEESRSRMLDKQNDPISIEKKINITLIDYSKSNKIKEDFGKCFVTQKELSAEQAF
ncbi:hypothetical protein Tco_1302169 [Tanacetum coccineum]